MVAVALGMSSKTYGFSLCPLPRPGLSTRQQHQMPEALFLLIRAYMFKYDSTHSPFKGSIKVVDVSTLEINGKQIKLQATGTSYPNAAQMQPLQFTINLVA